MQIKILINVEPNVCAHAERHDLNGFLARNYKYTHSKTKAKQTKNEAIQKEVPTYYILLLYSEILNLFYNNVIILGYQGNVRLCVRSARSSKGFG